MIKSAKKITEETLDLELIIKIDNCKRFLSENNYIIFTREELYKYSEKIILKNKRKSK
jgi:hypothetical protein